MIVLGKTVDDQTRCEHYHSATDVIAIRFYCCDTYYPCHLCHEETAGHASRQWPVTKRNVPAILCGVFGLVYFTAAFALSVPEARSTLGRLRRR